MIPPVNEPDMSCAADLEAAQPSRTPHVTIIGSTPSDNPFLGTSKMKRAVLQYAFVFGCMYAAYTYGVTNLSANVLYLPEKLFHAHAATMYLKIFASVFLFGLTLAPFFLWHRLPPTPAECSEFTNDPSFLGKIGVVIPCHKSRDEMEAVLERCLRYFKPEHIVVADNANNATPPDDTATVVRKVSPVIRYLYVPQGHKTRALMHGTLALPSTVEYVLHLDDDTLLSEQMVFDAAHFDDPSVSGVTFGIRMAGDAIVSRCVDWEFVLFSIYRTFQADRATAFFCHGIIGLWRRDRWTRHLSTHPSMPYGEDAWIGCDAITNDERIAGELRCWVSTYAPSRLLPALSLFGQCGAGGREQGYGASSIWKQRANRWYTNAPRRLNYRLSQLMHYKASSLGRGIWFRFYMLLHIQGIFVWLLAPLVFAASIYASPADGALKVLTWMGGVASARFVHTTLVSAAIALRNPALVPKLSTALAFPFYVCFLDVAFMYGHWRSILYYVPFWAHQRTKPQEWAAQHSLILASSAEHSTPVLPARSDAGSAAGMGEAAGTLASWSEKKPSKAFSQGLKAARGSMVSLQSLGLESTASSSSQASSRASSPSCSRPPRTSQRLSLTDASALLLADAGAGGSSGRASDEVV
mmetsp:Transcript_14788/g.39811  ORF Transcript_14788/g.39811 Transcript_14788/m.39811 type:complete len:638 (-) Transcript_14788:439-2352(-)